MNAPLRRWLLGTLSACCALSAASCSTGAPKAEGTPKIAIVVANVQLNFSKEMADGFATGAREVGGVTAQVLGPDIVDGPREVQLFNTAGKASPDGVSLFTLDPDLFVKPLSSATGAGLPVIAVDNPPPPGAGVNLFIGNDNHELGVALADLVITRLPAHAAGTVVIGTSSPGAPVLDQRAEGMRAEFARRLPTVHVLGPFDTKQEVQANLSAWKTLVAANPGAMAFLGTGDADGWNLASIRRQAHAAWLAGAFDLDPRALAAVKNGDLLLVSPEHFLKGLLAGRLQAARAKDGGKLPQGWLYVPGITVTPDNIDAIIARQPSTATKEAAVRAQADDILNHTNTSLRPLDRIAD